MKGIAMRCASVFPSMMLVLALALECNDTQARCIVHAPGANQADPAKALVRQAVDDSTAVFLGRVTALEYVPAPARRGDAGMLVIKLAASTWWKGAERREVRLNTTHYRHADGTASEEAHEFPYELGKTYLVYASDRGEGLYADVCTRTRPVEQAIEDIGILDGLKAR